MARGGRRRKGHDKWFRCAPNRTTVGRLVMATWVIDRENKMSSPFLLVPRVIFDHGALRELGAELAHLGIRRPLIVTDQGLVRAGALERLRAALPAGAAPAVFDHIPENPTVAGVHEALAVYRDEGCDGVVALGGGSVLDSAKGIAVLAGHPGPLTDYMGHPERITDQVAPLIAIPTTTGTGSEASRGSGIHPTETSRAIGLNSPYIVPRVAICDPDLTLTLPAHLTAATGMDALSHCIEGFLATPLNPVLDVVALDGARRVMDWIERAVADGNDREARWHMMLAALQGGMSIPMSMPAGPTMLPVPQQQPQQQPPKPAAAARAPDAFAGLGGDLFK